MWSTAVRYFREVALAGSLRRAAERLSIAPSALSRQVAKLEAELGVTLLERRAHGVALTDAGRALLAYADQASGQYEAFRAGLRGLAGGVAGEVRIASVEGVVPYLLSKYVAAFETSHPRVAVNVSVIGSRRVLEALREATVDLALAFGHTPRRGFVQHARLDQPLCVVMAMGHPLARKKMLGLAELAGARAALPDQSFEIRQMVDRMVRRSRVSLQQVLETNSLEMAKGAVRNSRLITFLPRYAALREIAARELCAVPLRDRAFTDTSVTLLTARAHELSPAAQALLDTLKAGMASYGRS